jgi:hypothetical protein
MLITKRHLEIYETYAGDEDGLARAGPLLEKRLFGPSDWAKIAALLQNLTLMIRLGTDESKAAALAAASRACDNDETLEALFKLADAGTVR